MAQTLEAIFYQGDQRKIDYTPSGSSPGVGKIIDLGNWAGVVTQSEGLTDGVLGAVEVDGIYKVKKAAGTGVTFASGADVFWDTVNLTAVAAAGANIFRLGMATEAAVTGDDHVKCWINHDGIQA